MWSSVMLLWASQLILWLHAQNRECPPALSSPHIEQDMDQEAGTSCHNLLSIHNRKWTPTLCLVMQSCWCKGSDSWNLCEQSLQNPSPSSWAQGPSRKSQPRSRCLEAFGCPPWCNLQCNHPLDAVHCRAQCLGAWYQSWSTSFPTILLLMLAKDMHHTWGPLHSGKALHAPARTSTLPCKWHTPDHATSHAMWSPREIWNALNTSSIHLGDNIRTRRQSCFGFKAINVLSVPSRNPSLVIESLDELVGVCQRCLITQYLQFGNESVEKWACLRMVEKSGIKEISAFDALLHSRFLIEFLSQLVVQTSFGSKILQLLCKTLPEFPHSLIFQHQWWTQSWHFCWSEKFCHWSFAWSSDPRVPPSNVTCLHFSSIKFEGEWKFKIQINFTNVWLDRSLYFSKLRCRIFGL